MYGLIGEKLRHSYSKYIHSLLGDYSYDLIELSSSQLEVFLKKGDFKGINVTVPYKKDVIPFLSTISPEAEKIGSVNTIVNQNSKLYGYNTDYQGFLYAAEQAGIDFKGKKVIILGTGGTSLTASTVAQDKGAEKITLVSRTGTINYENIYTCQEGAICADTEIIINTTPVGTYPNNGEKIIELSRFPSCIGVIDVIYNPLSTALILEAEKLGIQCTGGLPMLIGQAIYASKIFISPSTVDTTNNNSAIADDNVCEKTKQIFEKAEAEIKNIILIGMPGCGKTTIGKIISTLTGKTFVDTDTEIEKMTGKSIPLIFMEDGEEYFRQLEADIINTVGKENRRIIAVGGGAVLREENYRNLKQNGTIVFIQRELEMLATKGRPLSAGGIELLKKMYEIREPLYKKNSSITVHNENTQEETAEEIMKLI